MLDKGRLTERFPEGIRQRAKAWCSQIPSLDVIPSARILDRLGASRRIDVGEAFLFAAAAESAGSIVVTGDKRACRALAELDLPELAGRVLCLESCLLLLLEAVDFRTLIDSLGLVREFHQTLRVLLPQGASTPEADFRAGVQSYWRELLAQTGDLLWRP